MAYDAKVYRIMIASPGDVENERIIMREVIQEWNSVNSEDRGIVLLPVGWDTHSYPSMEGRAQEVLNKQILCNCDLLVASFWTRIGTPTGKSKSGTVEEIEEHLAANKPAMIYFSTAPVRPDSVDESQYSALRDFKESLQKRGLIESYESLGEFKDKFSRQLSQKAIHDLIGTKPTSSSHPSESGGPVVTTLNISEDAKTLLLEASNNPRGVIMAIRTMDGLSIDTGKRNFIEEGNARSEARWKKALEELVSNDFIRDMGHKGEVFQLTADGYDAADKIKLSR